MTGRDALSLPRQIMSSGSALGGWLAALCPGAPLPSNFCLVLSTRRTHGRDRRGGGKKVKDSSWISLSGAKGCGSSEGLLLSMTLPLHGRCSPGLHPWACITPAVLLRLAHVRGISTLANELPSDYPNSNATGTLLILQESSQLSLHTCLFVNYWTWFSCLFPKVVTLVFFKWSSDGMKISRRKNSEFIPFS